MLQSLVLLSLSALALAQTGEWNATPQSGAPLTASGLIPRIGLGTARMKGNTSEAVAKAIENGFRHLDCAYIYGNQKDVGIGIKEGLKRTGLKREDLWVTGKLWNDRHSRAEWALQESLNELQLGYLDLFLIHWPHSDANFTPEFDHVETWKSMQKLVKPSGAGTRFIGVSNFGPGLLDDLLKLPGLKPAFHEFELHPYVQQESWLEQNLKNNITVIAYAPLGNTQSATTMGVSVDRKAVPELLKTEVITSIAKARNCTPAQVVLAWNLHRRVVVIPKASQSDHQKENIATEKQCKLTDEDVAKFKTGIPESQRIRFYPNACGYGMEEGCVNARKYSTGKKNRKAR